MIKDWKQFESIDDDDLDLARMEMSQCDGFLSFYFRSFQIKNEEEIKELISLYEGMKAKHKEWSGGPVNREFDNLFLNRYKPSLTRAWQSNPYKPSIGLNIETDYGFFFSSFTIKGHKLYSYVPNPYDDKDLFRGERVDLFRINKTKNVSSVVGNMSRLWSDICNEKDNLEDVIDHFNIKTNYFNIFS